YTERSLNEISLGGLLVAVVLRTIQFNMTRMRDKYLHTNCLAALANMSSQFQNLHTYVSQRIVSLFNLLARKHSKTLDLIQQQSKQQQQQQQQQTLTTNTSNDNIFNEYAQDLSIIEDVMRMVLEIINSCLTHTLQHNINLVYTLLYNRDIFDNYRAHPSFQDILQNIDTVIIYFAEKVDRLEQRSTEYVKEALEMGAKQFPLDRLKKFPELKFKYVEEEQPEDFFVPYVWTLGHQMHVPHSITVGPVRSTFPRIHPDDDRVPVRMEVPDRLRPGGNGSMIALNDTDFFTNDESNSLSDSFIQQPSLPPILHPSDIRTTSDDEDTSVNIQTGDQAITLSQSWHVEPFHGIDDKNILNKLQLLQNRVRYIEERLARRQHRDRIFYSCVIGYFLLQALLSVRRSMLN
ncbi:unnamed protein product, partial [Rotaria sp. Silwood2]